MVPGHATCMPAATCCQGKLTRVQVGLISLRREHWNVKILHFLCLHIGWMQLETVKMRWSGGNCITFWHFIKSHMIRYTIKKRGRKPHSLAHSCCTPVVHFKLKSRYRNIFYCQINWNTLISTQAGVTHWQTSREVGSRQCLNPAYWFKLHVKVRISRTVAVVSFKLLG